MNACSSVVTVAFLTLVVGCGGASAPSGSQVYAPTAPAAEAAMPEGAARESVADSAPSERQGLATSWGERRESWVQDTQFVRADPNRPLRVFEIRYNDAAGVNALLGESDFYSDVVREPSLGSSEVSVELVGESGPRALVRANGNAYVVGTAGERYSIRVRNHTGRRLEVVASVDGLDVLNGKEASVKRRGYVVNGYDTLEIDGFRQSQGAVAAFRFGSVGESYAASKSDARNAGVIGVAVFNEYEARPSAEELRRRERATPFPGSDPRYAAPPQARAR